MTLPESPRRVEIDAPVTRYNISSFAGNSPFGQQSDLDLESARVRAREAASSALAHLGGPSRWFAEIRVCVIPVVDGVPGEIAYECFAREGDADIYTLRCAYFAADTRTGQDAALRTLNRAIDARRSAALARS